MNAKSLFKRLNFETMLTSLDRGRFIVVHLCSIVSFSLRRLMRQYRNTVMSKNMVKFGVFDPQGIHDAPIKLIFYV